VSILDSSSSPFQLLYGVPQGSVLGPLLFTLYTTPLSSHISSNPSISHQLYADDTQLFTSFSASDYASVLSVLESTISAVSSWISSNFLALNPTETKFLLIGNRSQLFKANTIILSMPKNVSIRPVSSAHKLGVISI
jgi:hypothetical protein